MARTPALQRSGARGTGSNRSATSSAARYWPARLRFGFPDRSASCPPDGLPAPSSRRLVTRPVRVQSRATSPRPPARAKQPTGQRSNRQSDPCGGKAPMAPSCAFSRRTRAIRAAVAATPWRAMASSSPASQSSLAPLSQQAVALGHRAVVCRHLSGMARVQCPNQAVQEAAAARCAFLEQPVHPGCQPDRGGAAGDLRLIARRGPIEPKYAAVEVAVVCRPRTTRVARGGDPVPISTSPSDV